MIYPSPAEMDCLRGQRDLQQKTREIAGNPWSPTIEDLVFTDGEGRPQAYDAVNKRFKRLVRTLGEDMEKTHLHTLRHTAASNFYHATKDVLLTMEFLGHADVRNTEIYTHSRPEDLQAIAAARDADAREMMGQ